MKLSLRTAARIAWRETRSSLIKFLFVVLAVAAGVGALSGVRGFSQSFESMLTHEARTMMAADLTARQFVVPNADQTAQLDALAAHGVERTMVTETVSMASATVPDAIPVLVSIKAVDPVEISLLRRSEAGPADAAGPGADAGYRGGRRRSADPRAAARPETWCAWAARISASPPWSSPSRTACRAA